MLWILYLLSLFLVTSIVIDWFIYLSISTYGHSSEWFFVTTCDQFTTGRSSGTSYRHIGFSIREMGGFTDGKMEYKKKLGGQPSLFLCLLQAKQIYLLSAVATSTAQATVQPTIGLLPMPRNPIISTCAGTEDEPAN